MIRFDMGRSYNKKKDIRIYVPNLADQGGYLFELPPFELICSFELNLFV